MIYKTSFVRKENFLQGVKHACEPNLVHSFFLQNASPSECYCGQIYLACIKKIHKKEGIGLASLASQRDISFKVVPHLSFHEGQYVYLQITSLPEEDIGSTKPLRGSLSLQLIGPFFSIKITPSRHRHITFSPHIDPLIETLIKKNIEKQVLLPAMIHITTLESVAFKNDNMLSLKKFLHHIPCIPKPTAQSPSFLYAINQELLLFLEKTNTIDTNDSTFLNQIQAYQEMGLIDPKTKVCFIHTDPWLENDWEIWESLQQSKITLPSGYNATFEKTALGYAIDCNTGKGFFRSSDNILSLLHAILDHIRWRAISGRILIDCLHTNDRLLKNNILKSLKIIAKKERIHIYGFTGTGLLEIIRPRSIHATGQRLINYLEKKNDPKKMPHLS